jgi:hypothetical protein
MAYGTVSYQAVHGQPLPGWYLWPAGGALAMIVVAGLGRATALPAAGLAAIDLYGAAGVLAPYYAGVVERNHARLIWPEVPLPLTLLWAAATVAIPAVAVWRAGPVSDGGSFRAPLFDATS